MVLEYDNSHDKAATTFNAEVAKSWTISGKETRNLSVGPGEKLYFYRHRFSGPDVDFDITTTAAVHSKEKKTLIDNQNVVVGVVSEPRQYVKDVDFVSGDNRSSGTSITRGQEWLDHGDDDNEGFGAG
ncbi:hypothetical protein F5Y06DRAFT_305479 [Hypoxylon sp. FL0890]|nr:hypothetical protein F5Y06DRAFT_305479 [Hypoxylon sp. FL0890]